MRDEQTDTKYGVKAESHEVQLASRGPGESESDDPKLKGTGCSK